MHYTDKNLYMLSKPKINKSDLLKKKTSYWRYTVQADRDHIVILHFRLTSQKLPSFERLKGQLRGVFLKVKKFFYRQTGQLTKKVAYRRFQKLKIKVHCWRPRMNYAVNWGYPSQCVIWVELRVFIRLFYSSFTLQLQ